MIYSDAIGNKFLGDCIYANHNITYPASQFLLSTNVATMNTDFTDLMTRSGLLHRNIASNAQINDTFSELTIVAFSSSSDTIDDRYTFSNPRVEGFSQGVIIYNNSGYSRTDNVSNLTNKVVQVGFSTSTLVVSNGGFHGNPKWFNTSDARATQISVAGVADNKALALFYYQKQHEVINSDYNELVIYDFYYAGELADVNTNFGYYSANILTKSIAFKTIGYDNFRSDYYQVGGGGHYIANAGKTILGTGDAQYPIACSDGQTPTAQWATDFYVFDNNATLGYPAIGRVRNLLLAQGSYTIGKPVRIQGTVQPDNGFNAWLPIGRFAGKTVLMRCYSSVSL